MGYKRRNYKKRYSKKQHPWAKTAGSALSMASKALTVAYGLKNLINVEKKFIDTSISGTALVASPSGFVSCISLVGQGTDLNQRIGDSIKYSSLMVEGFVTLNAATQDLIKVSIVLDRQTNASLPLYSDIYEVGAGSGATAQRNKLSVDRFKVLKEWNLDLETAGSTLKKFHTYIKFPTGQDYHEKFSGTGSTIASVYSNSIYIVFAGNLSTSMSAISYFTRIRYVDN
nr:capsid protein [Cressdnaviricota sp.]UOF81554.1 capsid protein [Cressdnaviricota sp.]